MAIFNDITSEILKQAQLRLCKLGLGTLFKGAIKSSIFVVQKAAAPKNGVEFRQRPIGDIRRSLATSHVVWRRRPKIKTHELTDRLTNKVRHRARYLR